MITLESAVYSLPEPTELRFFSSSNHFLRKVHKHFLSDREPWWRLLGVKILRRLRRNLDGSHVSPLEDVYRQAVNVFDEGIRFAAECPLFIKASEVVTTRHGFHRKFCVVHLIGKPGFHLVAHSGIVQTAYFHSKTSNDSYFTLFQEAWRSLRVRLHRQRLERNGRVAERNKTEFHNETTWSKCPNPYEPKLRPPRSLPTEVNAWLAQVDGVADE